MPFSHEGIAYLTIEDVFEAFAAAVNTDLRQASLALKSRDSLEAAIMRPLQWAHYQSADIALQAAVLAHGISETQNFLDGNKRTAAMALVGFLFYNNLRIVEESAEIMQWILDLSDGLKPVELGDLIRPRLFPLPAGTESPLLTSRDAEE